MDFSEYLMKHSYWWETETWKVGWMVQGHVTGFSFIQELCEYVWLLFNPLLYELTFSGVVQILPWLQDHYSFPLILLTKTHESSLLNTNIYYATLIYLQGSHGVVY